MESSHLVSWQFEDFSTAELSPPTSPISPSSPTLFYDGSNPASPSGSVKGYNNALAMPSQSQKPALSTVVSSRAQTASNMLNELERLHYFEHQNEFGMNANEESVDLNMNLFEELADIEYTPPLLSPEDTEVKPMETLVSEQSLTLATISPVSHLARIEQTPDNAKLTAEYKTILESLTTNDSTTTNSVISSIGNGNIIHIAGIPTTTVVGDECLVPVEFITRNGSIGGDEIQSMDLDGIIISTDMDLIGDEPEVIFGLEELSAELVTAAEEVNTDGKTATRVNGVLPYWAKDMTIAMDELDVEMNKNVNTLDALLKGDVTAAQNAITSGYSVAPFSPVSNVTLEEDQQSIEDVQVVEPKTLTKPERRGRKPAKAYKDPMTQVKDKALRKKEQNKTAATRYRLKKKQELAVTLSEEDELQQVNDELNKEKEKVGAELRMIRSLLREMLQVRKKRVSPPTSAGQLTASSIVQAQRAANRRK